MISALFSSVKPKAAAAQPEYELSIDTTTGMSAPPIGMISVIPRISAIAVSSRNIQGCDPCVCTIITTSTTMATPNAMLMICRAGSMIGEPDMLPLSFRKAITDPVKVRAPIAEPSDNSMIEAVLIAPVTPMP